MNGQITVKKLKELCEEEIKKGNGDKNIVISNDNEGNGFHGLLYEFTPIDCEDEDGAYYSYEEDICDSVTTDNEHTIILG